MIYNIGDNPETAKLLQQTMPPNTKVFFARPFCIKLQKLFVGRCTYIL